MEAIIDWMKVTENLEKYKTKSKMQTFRELSGLLPGKTEKQIKNKLDSVERKYKDAKVRTKQTGLVVYDDDETIKSWTLSFSRPYLTCSLSD